MPPPESAAPTRRGGASARRRARRSQYKSAVRRNRERCTGLAAEAGPTGAPGQGAAPWRARIRCGMEAAAADPEGGGPPDGPPVLRVLPPLGPMGPVSYNPRIIGHGRADPDGPGATPAAKHKPLMSLRRCNATGRRGGVLVLLFVLAYSRQRKAFQRQASRGRPGILTPVQNLPASPRTIASSFGVPPGIPHGCKRLGPDCVPRGPVAVR